jgi:transcriptional regulator with XRE-family HTH domain
MAIKADWFSDILKLYNQRTGFTLSQLSRLSGIPKPTLANWLSGRVNKPRRRSDVVRLAKALHLEEIETRELLKAAGHAPINQASNEQSQHGPTPELIQFEEKEGHVPFQAIADLPYFVGRKAELEVLKGVLLDRHGSSILTLEGMPGVGKTALAARLAYQMRPFFPDGVLWARLNHSSSEIILSTFADAYGVDIKDYTQASSRSRILRETLADKRTLIILDDAWQLNQVLPLLPPTGDSRLVVTTPRRALLAALGAHRFHLHPFPESGIVSLMLFAKLIGSRIVEANQQTILELAHLLGHLPLALAITANRLAFEPEWGILEYLKRIKCPKQRLDLLVYEGQSLRSAFSRSVQTLNWSEKRFFNSLAELNPAGFSTQAAATLNKLSTGQTQAHLRKLYHLFLVEMNAPDRFYLHALVRDYARQALGSSNENSSQT